MRQREKEETALFYTGWALLAISCLLWMFYRLFPGLFTSLLVPCLVKSTLGHPLVLYTAVVGGWFLISQTIARVSGRRLNIGMKYRDGYVWAALVIVIVNFIVKNLLLLLFHVDLLKDFHL